MSHDSIKRRITKAVLEQTPSAGIDLESAMKTFWLDIRTNGSLRLTEAGDHVFLVADIENFEFPLDLKALGSELLVLSYQTLVLELSKKIPCPYYIGKHSQHEWFIRIYDSSIAMLITLHGDIYSYLSDTRTRRK